MYSCSAWHVESVASDHMLGCSLVCVPRMPQLCCLDSINAILVLRFCRPGITSDGYLYHLPASVPTPVIIKQSPRNTLSHGYP